LVRTPPRKHLLLRDAEWGLRWWRKVGGRPEEFVSQRWAVGADCGLRRTSEPWLDPWDAEEKKSLQNATLQEARPWKRRLRIP